MQAIEIVRARPPGHAGDVPSPWVVRHLPALPRHGRVLDLACGHGRHARLLASEGFLVEAVDRDAQALAGLCSQPGIEVRECDLEGGAWPYFDEQFDGIVVTRYLHRPRLDALAATLRPGGVIIYETFMVGHERFGRPTSPDFLLQPWELLRWAVRNGLHAVAFEQGADLQAGPAVLQRIVARRPG